MDRSSWMYGSLRCTKDFLSNLNGFIEAAEKNAADRGETEIRCPCVDCKNIWGFHDMGTIKSHLLIRGFVKDYTIWTSHGEVDVNVEAEVDLFHDALDDDDSVFMDECINELNDECNHFDQVRSDFTDGVHVAGNDDGGGGRVGDEEDDDYLEELLWNIGPEVLLKSSRGKQHLEMLKRTATESLYNIEKCCPSHWTVLRFVLELLILKAKYGWSDCSFNYLLSLMSWVLPQPNHVPANTYEVKKVISPLTMGVEKIHACPNHCILFHGNTFKSLDKCPRCGPGR